MGQLIMRFLCAFAALRLCVFTRSLAWGFRLFWPQADSSDTGDLRSDSALFDGSQNRFRVDDDGSAEEVDTETEETRGQWRARPEHEDKGIGPDEIEDHRQGSIDDGCRGDPDDIRLGKEFFEHLGAEVLVLPAIAPFEDPELAAALGKPLCEGEVTDHAHPLAAPLLTEDGSRVVFSQTTIGGTDERVCGRQSETRLRWRLRSQAIGEIDGSVSVEIAGIFDRLGAVEVALTAKGRGHPGAHRGLNDRPVVADAKSFEAGVSSHRCCIENQVVDGVDRQHGRIMNDE